MHTTNGISPHLYPIAALMDVSMLGLALTPTCAPRRTEIGSTEITQETSCPPKVGGVETFGKPVVNRL